MLDFIFENSTKIVFGKESEKKLGELVAAFGDKVLVVYGGGSVVRSGLLGRCLKALEEKGIGYVELSGVKPNPRMSKVYEGIEICKTQGIKGILAVGGGSTIDTCKAIAMGAMYDGDAWDFFCGTQAKAALPLGVVLTIPAAGSESSSDCVVTNENGWLKRASCAAEFLRPRFAIMNPVLTFTLPAYQTACGACDMIAHVMERYFTPTNDVDVTDRLCESLIRSVVKAAPVAIANPEDYASRAELMWAGTLAHNSLVGMGRVNDWTSHGMGHEVSALYDAAHGATLSIMFPAWMKYVYSENVGRFAQFASRVFDVPFERDNQEAMAVEGIRRFEEFVKSIGLPTRLSEIGVKREDLPIMAKKCAGDRVIGGFKKLTAADVEKIYEIAY